MRSSKEGEGLKSVTLANSIGLSDLAAVVDDFGARGRWIKALLFTVLVLLAPLVRAQTEQDPWESFNRAVYSFNEQADRYLTKPLARGYRAVMPDAAQRAVSRAYSNLGEVSSSVNHLLQGKGYSSANSAGRFLVNSSRGVAGLFDVAETFGLRRQDSEDFGQTLAVWGVGSGPYLVLPLLGPSTLRDAPTKYPERYLDPITYLADPGARNAMRFTGVISLRSELLDAERVLPAKDPYSFVRDAWLQRRDYQVRDGQVADEFGAGFDDFLD